MNSISTGIGNPPSPQVIYERLFDFIDTALLTFNVKKINCDGVIASTEDAITEDLSEYLDNEQELLNQDRDTSFRFTNQSMGKTDIGVKFGRCYRSNNRAPFCWIEAKRLPTPLKNNRDEREYVFVSPEKINGKKKYKGNGGIQRFKENKHAPKLSYSVMIGYIQKENVMYWFRKINGWINDLIKTDPSFWGKNDCLQQYNTKKTKRFVSVHSRKDNVASITLHHFWIQLQNHVSKK
ncbi:MAG: hypothetical protein LBV16_04535 [Elusimicrobiota bacterium]|jgi:hypothetical protein|nr:hypothetical protein [Elusimicrobiota bacterium]